MGVTITIDEKLVADAERLSGQHDRVKLVEQALDEFIRKRSKFEAMLALAGKAHLRDDYDYKSLRAARNDDP